MDSYRGPRRQQVDTPLGVGNNPFGERPLSARQPSNTAALLKALDELDDVSHIPEGLIVDVPIWKRMCGLRREKVISEQEVSVVVKICNDGILYHKYILDMLLLLSKNG